jgi:hypothetical protein
LVAYRLCPIFPLPLSLCWSSTTSSNYNPERLCILKQAVKYYTFVDSILISVNLYLYTITTFFYLDALMFCSLICLLCYQSYRFEQLATTPSTNVDQSCVIMFRNYLCHLPDIRLYQLANHGIQLPMCFRFLLVAHLGSRNQHTFVYQDMDSSARFLPFTDSISHVSAFCICSIASLPLLKTNECRFEETNTIVENGIFV